MMYKKYDVLLDKGYNQMELAVMVINLIEHGKFVFN
jgi:hypothetical protein